MGIGKFNAGAEHGDVYVTKTVGPSTAYTISVDVIVPASTVSGLGTFSSAGWLFVGDPTGVEDELWLRGGVWKFSADQQGSLATIGPIRDLLFQTKAILTHVSGTTWTMEWQANGVTIWSPYSISLPNTETDPFEFGIGALFAAGRTGEIYYVGNVVVKDAANATVFSDDFSGSDFSHWDAQVGTNLSVVAVPEQPEPLTNDNFVDAIVLDPVSGSILADNSSATAESPDPLVDDHGSGQNTIWYRVTPSADGYLQVYTEGQGTGFDIEDTKLAVYSGTTLAGLTELAFNDDLRFNSFYSYIDFVPVTAGTTYHIAVAGYDDSNTGTFRLRWSVGIPAPPINTSCTTAKVLPGTGGDVRDYDNRLVTAWDVSDPLFAELGVGGGAPLWFKWTNLSDSLLTVGFAMAFPLVGIMIEQVNAAVYRGTCGALTVAYSVLNQGTSGGPQLVSLDVAAGETIYIEIDGYSGDAANPPTLPIGQRGRFRLGVAPTLETITHKDALDGSPVEGDSGPLTESFGVGDCVELDGEVWSMFLSPYAGFVNPLPCGPFAPGWDTQTLTSFVRRWDGSAWTDYTLPLDAGDAHITYRTAGGVLGGEGSESPGRIETDGTNIWVAIPVSRTLTNPYNGGSWTQTAIAVFVWDGSAFVSIGSVDPACANRDLVSAQGYGGPATPNMDNGGYASPPTLIADSAAPGDCYLGWAEQGHEGTVYSSSFQFRSRIVLAKFSPSGKVVEQDAFLDRTPDNSGNTIWQNNIDPAGHEGCSNNRYALGVFQFALSTGTLQMFNVPPFAAPSSHVGWPVDYLDCYSVDPSTLLIRLEQTIDYVRPTFNTSIWLASPVVSHLVRITVERQSHVDDNTGQTVRNILFFYYFPGSPTIRGNNQQTCAWMISEDLATAAHLYDQINDSTPANDAAVLVDVRAGLGVEAAFPGSRIGVHADHQRIITDVANQTWVIEDTGLIFFDRKCSHSWRYLKDRLFDGTEDTAGTRTNTQVVSTIYKVSWSDGDDMRFPQVVPTFSGSAIDSLSYHMSKLHIGRWSAVCTDTFAPFDAPFAIVPSFHVSKRY
jgi:hypothetical protein